MPPSTTEESVEKYRLHTRGVLFRGRRKKKSGKKPKSYIVVGKPPMRV